VLELDGNDDPPAAYETGGLSVLHACDVLVAVWDGKPEAGRGGTGSIVAFAIDASIPVIWIATDSERPAAIITNASAPEIGALSASRTALGDLINAIPPASRMPLAGAGSTRAQTRDGHLFAPGPKRILSIDGGGVRGAVATAFLERLESEIAEIEGRPVRLAEWFDLIGGTSTGAIIAVGLALGYRASEMRDFYEQLAPRIFKRSFFRLLGWHAKFDARNLMTELSRIIGTRTLDSADLKTGLCIVLKRMDTGSAWMVMNNPRSIYWETPVDRTFIGNRHLPLTNLVRASTAAPTFFDPELIEIAPGLPRGLFIDGGLTPHNNPSLMLLLSALLPGYGLNWKLDPTNLTIVSVGTGTYRETMDPFAAMRSSALGLALRSLAAMISDSEQLVLTLMTYFGQSPVAWPINSELGDLGRLVPPTNALFRFLRYDLKLEQKWLAETLNEQLPVETVVRLREMDRPENVPVLYNLGQKAAALQIRRQDLTAT